MVPAIGVKPLLNLLVYAALAYAVIVVFVWWYQPRMLYLPDMPGREHLADPGHLGLNFEDVWLEGTDGVRAHAWWIPANSAKRSLVFFHGNAGNISHRLDSLAIFHELGLNVLMVDYRGYGKSEGSPSEQGTLLDGLAAWEHLVEDRDIEPDDIVIFGRSLGGAVAAQLATERQPAALIMESTFTSVPDLGAELYPWLPVRLLSRIQYDTGSKVADFDVPVLIVHGPGDDIIPYHHGQTLFERASEPRQFMEIPGGHNGGYLMDRPAYLTGLRQFLDSY